MPEKIVAPTVSRNILQVQHWFAVNVENLENMIGARIETMTVTYDRVEGIGLEYTLQQESV